MDGERAEKYYASFTRRAEGGQVAHGAAGPKLEDAPKPAVAASTRVLNSAGYSVAIFSSGAEYAAAAD